MKKVPEFVLLTPERRATSLTASRGKQDLSFIPSCASEIASRGGTLSPSRHRHGDVAWHLHLPGLFRRLLVGLGRHRHALLFLQLPAAQAEAPPRGAPEGAMSADRGDGATQLSPRGIPASSSSSPASTATFTAAQGAAAVLPSSDPVAASSSAGPSSHATGKLGQHAR